MSPPGMIAASMLALALASCDESRDVVRTPEAPSARAPSWPFRHGDAAHSRRSSNRVAAPLVVKWSRSLDATPFPPPFVVDGDGRILVGSHDGASMLSPSGAVLWHVASATPIRDVAWPDPDRLLVASDVLRALDVSANEKWRASCDDARFQPASLADDGDGNVTFTCHRTAYSLARDGGVRWRHEVVGADSNLLGAPVAFEASLFFTTVDGVAAVRAKTGEALWQTRATLGAGLYGDGSLLADAATRELWRFELIGGHARLRIDGGAPIETTKDRSPPREAARLSRGVVAADGAGLQAWDDAGVAAWSVTLGAPARSVAVDADDLVVTATDRELVGVHEGRVEWRVDLPGGGEPTQLAIAAGGDVVVATDAPALHVFGGAP